MSIQSNFGLSTLTVPRI